MNNSMIKKKAKQSKPSCYFKVGFFLSFLREKKRKKKDYSKYLYFHN